MARNTIYELSQTDASNINSLTGLLAADTQAPSTVDNTMRGTMAFIAEMLADLTGTTAPGTANDAAGTANALTVTANASFTTQAQGRRVSLKATADNTGAATLAVNSLTAKKIRVMEPSGADIDISAGMITDNGTYEFIYDEDADSGSGGWMLLNPTRSGSTSYWAAIANTTLSSATWYINPNANNNMSPIDTTTKVLMPGPITIKNLYIGLSAAPGSGENFTYTVQKNGSDTSVTATISNTDTTGSDTSNSAAFAAGDYVSVKLVRSGSATTNAVHRISMQLTTA